MQLDAF
jgi:hypothetical protein